MSLPAYGKTHPVNGPQTQARGSVHAMGADHRACDRKQRLSDLTGHVARGVGPLGPPVSLKRTVPDSLGTRGRRTGRSRTPSGWRGWRGPGWRRRPPAWPSWRPVSRCPRARSWSRASPATTRAPGRTSERPGTCSSTRSSCATRRWPGRSWRAGRTRPRAWSRARASPPAAPPWWWWPGSWRTRARGWPARPAAWGSAAARWGSPAGTSCLWRRRRPGSPGCCCRRAGCWLRRPAGTSRTCRRGRRWRRAGSPRSRWSCTGIWHTPGGSTPAPWASSVWGCTGCSRSYTPARPRPETRPPPPAADWPSRALCLPSRPDGSRRRQAWTAPSLWVITSPESGGGAPRQEKEGQKPAGHFQLLRIALCLKQHIDKGRVRGLQRKRDSNMVNGSLKRALRNFLSFQRLAVADLKG